MGPSPAAEAMTVAASAARSSRRGSRPGIVRASSVLPEPGGPINNNPWPPARATSRPRRASTWPRTSDRSGTNDMELSPGLGVTLSASSAAVSSSASCPSAAERSPPTSSTRAGAATRIRVRRAWTISTAWRSRSTPDTVIPSTSRASSTASVATSTRPMPRRARAATIGRTPGTDRTSPPSDSSPMSATPPEPGRICSDPRRIPTAIARSSDAPVFRRSAGARLTVIRRGGWVNPSLRNAPRTRSRDSWSAASARPTTVNPGRPGATSTSTRMNRPARPWSVADGTMASTSAPYAPGLTSRSTATHPALIERALGRRR